MGGHALRVFGYERLRSLHGAAPQTFQAYYAAWAVLLLRCRVPVLDAGHGTGWREGSSSCGVAFTARSRDDRRCGTGGVALAATFFTTPMSSIAI